MNCEPNTALRPAPAGTSPPRDARGEKHPTRTLRPRAGTRAALAQPPLPGGAASPWGCLSPLRSAGHPARTPRSPEGDPGAVPGAAWSGEQPSLPRAQRIRSRNGTPGEGTGLSPGRRLPSIPGSVYPRPGAASLWERSLPPSRGAARRGAAHPALMRRPGRRRGAVLGEASPRGRPRPSGQGSGQHGSRSSRTPGAASPPARRRLHKRGRGAARQRGRAVVSARGVRAPPSPETPPPCRPRQRASPQPPAAQLRAAQRPGSDCESSRLRSGAGGCGALAVAWRGPERAPERAPERGQTGRRLSRRLSLRAPPSHRPRRRPRARRGATPRRRRARARMPRRTLPAVRGGLMGSGARVGVGSGTRVGREKRETRRGPHHENPSLKHEALDEASRSTQFPRWRARRERDAKVHPACAGSGLDELGGGGGGVTAPGAPWLFLVIRQN
ncbi:serine/arginine repetitive matrix protein 1-like [Moschus berezovskii]|uniref:serine/arginine repetitive matrix protein 1-like n=1 Tax=Moschus berezovskii TaxID=68408 RepID=UPI002444F6D1|nr:serine/arginine repetitive matrix protein 1-like [Moschus berezovskii]